jgi:hypothetical protein
MCEEILYLIEPHGTASGQPNCKPMSELVRRHPRLHAGPSRESLEQLADAVGR